MPGLGRCFHPVRLPAGTAWPSAFVGTVMLKSTFGYALMRVMSRSVPRPSGRAPFGHLPLD